MSDDQRTAQEILKDIYLLMNDEFCEGQFTCPWCDVGSISLHDRSQHAQSCLYRELELWYEGGCK